MSLNTAKNNHKNKKKNSQKQKYILLSSLSTLLAACGSEGGKILASIGDVEGAVTNAADQVTLGLKGAAGTVDLGGGDDVVVGGAKADFIRGGAGADNIKGGAGRDNLVMIGTTKNAGYKMSDLTNPNGTGIDLSGLLDLDDINNNSVSDAQAGEVIDGGADGAVLFVYGKVDFTGIKLINITIIDVHSVISIPASTLKSLIDGGVFQQINGDGSTELTITNDGSKVALDLSQITMKNIAKISLAEGVTLKLDQADLEGTEIIEGKGSIQAVSNMLDLDGLTVSSEIKILDQAGNEILPKFASNGEINVAENTLEVGILSVADESAVGNVAYALSGADAALFNLDINTGKVSFKEATDFENAKDQGADNQYDIVITATDSRGKETSQNVQINVTDVVEKVAAKAQFSLGDDEYFTVSKEQFVREDTTHSIQNLRIAGFDEGGVMMWVENSESNAGNYRGAIKGKLIDANGNYGSEELRFDSEEGYPINDYRVEALKNGNFVVMWGTEIDHEDRNEPLMKGGVFDKDGSLIGDYFIFNEDTHHSHDNYYYTEYEFEALEAGGFALQWVVREHIENQDGSKTFFNQSFIRFFDQNGQPKSGDIPMGDNGEHEIIFIDRGADGFAVIRDLNQANDQRIDERDNIIKFYDAAGQEMEVATNKINRSTDTTRHKDELEYVVLSDGGVVVVWEVEEDGKQVSYGRIFKPDGSSVGDDILVSEERVANEVIALPNGGFKVLWHGDFGKEEHQAMRHSQTFDRDGNKVGEALIDMTWLYYEENQHGDGGRIKLKDAEFYTRTSDREIISTVHKKESDLQRYDIKDHDDVFNDHLIFSVTAPNADAGETIGKILISNVPDGLTFNNGVNKGDGVWEMTQADLMGLTFQAEVGFNGYFELKVTAETLGNGVAADNIASFTFPVIISQYTRSEAEINVDYPDVDLLEFQSLPALTTEYDLGETVGGNLVTAYDISALDYQKTQDLNIKSPSHEPSVTIKARGTEGQYDIYKFTVTEDVRMIFDIDNKDLADANFNSNLQVLNQTGERLHQDWRSDFEFGGEGSNSDYDAYIEYTFSPGTYYLKVGHKSYPNDLPFPQDANYVLRVSKSALEPKTADDAITEFFEGSNFLDSLTYAGDKLDYDISVQDSYLKIKHIDSGTVDLIHGIENLKFADQNSQSVLAIFDESTLSENGFENMQEYQGWLNEAYSFDGGYFGDLV